MWQVLPQVVQVQVLPQVMLPQVVLPQVVQAQVVEEWAPLSLLELVKESYVVTERNWQLLQHRL